MKKINNDSLNEILELNNLKNEIDFVLKQLSNKMECKAINQIPVAKKYNIPYGSKIASLISFVQHNEKPKDTIVQSVIEQFKQRSEVGINKYGVTLDRQDLDRIQWLQHAQEEAMDLILYLEKLKQYEK
jgi:uncharacterized 2Fe-2S/4Fe-4S cluster protein (DUF4445 family)